jgi:ice-binding like protein
MLGTSVANMQTAFNAANALTSPDFLALGAGDISGKTLTPGLYKWTTGL